MPSTVAGDSSGLMTCTVPLQAGDRGQGYNFGETWAGEGNPLEGIGQPIIGDVNGDGVFGSSDLVAVFQAAEFEDGVAGNSTFFEGDWNGDGDFDSADLVLAFQQGHYAELPLDDIAAAIDEALQDLLN